MAKLFRGLGHVAQGSRQETLCGGCSVAEVDNTPGVQDCRTPRVTDNLESQKRQIGDNQQNPSEHGTKLGHDHPRRDASDL